MTEHDLSAYIQESIIVMQEQVTDNDTEVAHGKADAVLCDVLEKIAATYKLPSLLRLVQVWQEVPKWYA